MSDLVELHVMRILLGLIVVAIALVLAMIVYVGWWILPAIAACYALAYIIGWIGTWLLDR